MGEIRLVIFVSRSGKGTKNLQNAEEFNSEVAQHRIRRGLLIGIKRKIGTLFAPKGVEGGRDRKLGPSSHATSTRKLSHRQRRVPDSYATTIVHFGRGKLTHTDQKSAKSLTGKELENVPHCLLWRILPPTLLRPPYSFFSLASTRPLLCGMEGILALGSL